MKKVFLVDDQRVMNLVHHKFINMVDPELKVDSFLNGSEALEALEKDLPELIFLDLNMPVMNGWQFLDEVKMRQLDLNVVILTSSNSLQDQEKSLEYQQVKKFVQKPLDRSGFEEILEAL
ncbi:response regulator [Litoribacter ruber]|uniref:Response regulator n=1 Tax=Litoribacter ruber TaxID=702568 RepID=A0AAP2CIL8_9BACT|nr:MULTISPECIES: response regulator [Litoribacter]MBS9524530.1 response regulator [Litoribacter alkaliphilus]MBT0810310.1 response regulator [Litoribacter ruber]